VGHTVVLIRGWFFTKSWRKHRARNTLIILLLAVFTIQVTPLPAVSADAYPSILDQFVFDHLKERLALNYGGEENIPPLDPAVANGYRPVTPPAGENDVLREAALYFLPDGLRRDARRAWTRAAKALSTDEPVRTAALVQQTSRSAFEIAGVDARATKEDAAGGPPISSEKWVGSQVSGFLDLHLVGR